MLVSMLSLDFLFHVPLESRLHCFCSLVCRCPRNASKVPRSLLLGLPRWPAFWYTYSVLLSCCFLCWLIIFLCALLLISPLLSYCIGPQALFQRDEQTQSSSRWRRGQGRRASQSCPNGMYVSPLPLLRFTFMRFHLLLTFYVQESYTSHLDSSSTLPITDSSSSISTSSAVVTSAFCSFLHAHPP